MRPVFCGQPFAATIRCCFSSTSTCTAQTYNKSEYPGPDYTIPFARSAVRREGTDLVVVTWGALVQRTLVAAQQAEREGISAAVIDLRTIAPYDWQGVAAYIRRVNRVVIAHEDQITCGFGAEIAARIADELFDYLDAPVRRVGALDTPVAYHPDLEEVILPQSSDVLDAIRVTARLLIRSLNTHLLRLVACSAASFALLTPAVESVARRVEVLRSVRALPPYIAGRFFEPLAYQQAASGQYLRVRSPRRIPCSESTRSAKAPGRSCKWVTKKDGFCSRARSASSRVAPSWWPTRRTAASGCSSSARPARGSAGFRCQAA